MNEPNNTEVQAQTRALASLDLSALLRGETEVLINWIDVSTLRRTWQQIILLLLGSGVFGASLGIWRDPLQAIYTAVKLPLILLLTVAGNALVNGMLAPLLGVSVSMRTSLAAVLLSFALASAVLGAFSPIILFIVWNAPSPFAGSSVIRATHGLLVLILAGVIGFAGTTANFRLRRLLRSLGGSESVSWRILLSWLSINLLLGSQISWVLRPFIGTSHLPVSFLTPNPFHGSFFGTIFEAVQDLFR